MENKRLLFFASLLTLIVASTLLITGSPILTLPSPALPSIPLGTFITWLGMLSLPLSIYSGVRKLRQPHGRLYPFLAAGLKLALLAAILWVPVCYLLAGNLSFSFSEKEGFQGGQLAMRWFWRFSYAIPALSIGVLLVHWLASLGARLKGKAI
jgi:hypothetical protein